MCANAFEPPRDDLSDVLSRGEAAFLAKATESGPVTEKAYEISSTLKLEIQYCFYGVGCNQGDILNLTYTLKTTKENALPVQFPLATEIIFILNRDLAGRVHFDSDWPGGIDKAYVCDNHPYSIMNTQEKIACVNIYGGKGRSWVKWEELIKMAKKKDKKNQGSH
jgi:hypothetical protein